MPRSLRFRSLTKALLIASLGGAVFVACQPSGGASPTAPPAVPSPSPSVAVVDGGTITLTDDGCTWDGNPGPVRGAEVTIELVNETDDYGVFIVHRLKPEFTWEDGRDAIEAIQVALAAGEDWPNWSTNVSVVEGEAAAEAGGTGVASVAPTAGTKGVVCSANTSPTGDILTVFLVGPLEVANQ
jgi:hypothetical protein